MNTSVTKRLTIAIDGPASSGKGTVARSVARALDYAYIDTGAMYRSVALAALKRGVSLSRPMDLGQLTSTLEFDFRWDGAGLRVLVNGEDWSDEIRTETVGKGASDVAVHPEVRTALLARQRALAEEGGVVMDGRDIGSVVLPNADLKIYLDASVDERARRRHAELTAKGLSVTLESIRTEVADRDHQDRTRKEAPLIRTDDAVYLDTTSLSADASARRIVEMVADLA